MNTIPDDLCELDHQMLLDEAVKMRELLHQVADADMLADVNAARFKVREYINNLPK